MKNWRRGGDCLRNCNTAAFAAQLQHAAASVHEVIHDTPEWKGERFADGRPKVPDAILDRMKSVTLEEAWATLRTAGYEQQYEDGWTTLYPDKILVGRALTSTWSGPAGFTGDRSKPTARWTAARAGPMPGRWTCCSRATRCVSDHFGLKVNGPFHRSATMSASMPAPATARHRL